MLECVCFNLKKQKNLHNQNHSATTSCSIALKLQSNIYTELSHAEKSCTESDYSITHHSNVDIPSKVGMHALTNLLIEI